MKREKVIILGGDLWGGMIAYHLLNLDPTLDLEIYEPSTAFGRHHTWTFLEKDVTSKMHEFLAPFVTKSWNEFTVKFPKYKKEIACPFHTMTSERFHEVLLRDLPSPVVKLETTVTLEDAVKRAKFVIDTRGNFLPANSGYKKIVALEVKLTGPHGVTSPVLMDATINQMDGYRSLQYFPTSLRTIIVEETRYSESAQLDVQDIKRGLERIIQSKNWVIEEVLRVEEGVTPLPLEKFHVTDHKGVINLSGLFHITTGNPVPVLMRFLEDLNLDSLDEQTLRLKVDHFRRGLEKQKSFLRKFNKLIFKTSPVHDRYLLWQHLYNLPVSVIERFHSGKLNPWDKARLLLGKSQMPRLKTMKTIFDLGPELRP